MALFLGPMHFCKFVFISTLVSALYSLLETSTAPHNLTMKAQGSEFILSWQPGNNTGTAIYYRVKYKAVGTDCLIHQTSNAVQSKSPKRNQVPRAPSNKPRLYDFKIAKECSNITNLFCNLTKEMTEFCRIYYIVVEQFTESGIQRAYLPFSPYSEICLPPAWFDIAACPNCINVTVKLSSWLLEKYNQFRYTVKLIKAGFTETHIDNFTRKASFHTVVGVLSPNTNYCISVDVSSSVYSVNQCTPSPLKCVLTSSKDKSGLIAFSVISGIIMVAVLIFSVFLLLKAGFVCLREKWPKVLNIIPKLGNSLEPLDPKTHCIQITQKAKRKGTECNYDDECESDGENDGGYTRHGLLHKISQSGSKAEHTEQLSIDSSSVASDCPLLGAVNSEHLNAEAENLQCHTNESTTSQIFDSTSELNFTSLPEPESGGCLNINLNTVMVGISDINWEADATLSSYEGDAADLQEPCVSDASELRHLTEGKDVQHSEVHNLSYAQNSGSGESESSDSETDCIGEYMRR